MKKHLKLPIFISALFLPCLLLSCTNSATSLSYAYETVLYNDAQAEKFFTISEDKKVVNVLIDNSEFSINYETQILNDLSFFMCICSFTFNNYKTVENSYKNNLDGHINSKYSCIWTYDANIGFAIVFK